MEPIRSLPCSQQPSTGPILSHIHPVYTTTSCFSMINLVVPSQLRLRGVFKSFWNLSINNIFLYLELIEYYPLQNSPLAQQCTSPIAFFTFGSTLRRLFALCFQVSRCICEDIFHCLQSSFFEGNFECREKKKAGRGEFRWLWGRLWKSRYLMFRQELSNWQPCVSRRIIVMEEPASSSPHFR
jgi:hypothetical protein